MEGNSSETNCVEQRTLCTRSKLNIGIQHGKTQRLAYQCQAYKCFCCCNCCYFNKFNHELPKDKDTGCLNVCVRDKKERKERDTQREKESKEERKEREQKGRGRESVREQGWWRGDIERELS